MNFEIRMKQLLTADPNMLAEIDAILAGERPAETRDSGPLLLSMGAAAETLGVSRTTLWRLLQANRLARIELLPGSYRIRRADLEALVKGQNQNLTSTNRENKL